MARQGSGIEVRGDAIRIQFSINGDVVRRTFKRDGRTQAPTPKNLADAHRLAVEIRERITSGTFCRSKSFPATGKDGNALTVGEQLDAWMAVQGIEASTAASYRSAIRFWKDAPCDDGGAKLADRAHHRLKPGQVSKASTL